MANLHFYCEQHGQKELFVYNSPWNTKMMQGNICKYNTHFRRWLWNGGVK